MNNTAQVLDPKPFIVAFNERIPAAAGKWRDETDWSLVFNMLEQLAVELKKFNIDLQFCEEPNAIAINGYGDILNSVRLRYPASGFVNTCLGHILGPSPNRDLVADLKRGINRILFAPETIEPQGSDKIVCHNCGCGC